MDYIRRGVQGHRVQAADTQHQQTRPKASPCATAPFAFNADHRTPCQTVDLAGPFLTIPIAPAFAAVQSNEVYPPT